MKSTRLVRQQSRAPRGPSLNANSARIVSASLADTSHQLPTSDTKGPPFGSATIASLPGRQTIATEDSSTAVPMTEEERREAEMRKIKESMRKERERIEREGVQGQEELEEKRKRRSISMSKNNRLKVVVADKTNYLQSKESMIIKLQEETVGFVDGRRCSLMSLAILLPHAPFTPNHLIARLRSSMGYTPSILMTSGVTQSLASLTTSPGMFPLA